VTERRDPWAQQGIKHQLKRVVWGARLRIGVSDYEHARYLLENVIFPELRARSEMRRILFVGCDRATRHYPRLFADREFATLDMDPGKARYGAEKHVTATLDEVREHFEPGSLDAVICNGVIGWGLDDRDEIDSAVTQCYDCLRPGGIFIVGWNDREPWRPVDLDSIGAFARFAPFTPPPFPGPVYPTLGEMRHVYNFYVRPVEGR
jgi:SAM-dependent methyltransferase